MTDPTFNPSHRLDRIDVLNFNAVDAIGIGTLQKRLRPECPVEIHTDFFQLGDLGFTESGEYGRLLIAWVSCTEDRDCLSGIADQIEEHSGIYPYIHMRGGSYRRLTKNLRDDRLAIGDAFPYVEFYRELCYRVPVHSRKEMRALLKLNDLLDPPKRPKKPENDLCLLSDVLGGIDYNPRFFQKRARQLSAFLAENLRFPEWVSVLTAAFFDHIDRTEWQAYERIVKHKPYSPPGIYVIPDPELHPLLFTADRSPNASSLPDKLKIEPHQLMVLSPMRGEDGKEHYEVWAPDEDILHIAMNDLRSEGLYSDGSGVEPDTIAKVIPVLSQIAF